MGQRFTLQTGTLAVGDPTMGLVSFSLALPTGDYLLGPQALRRVADESPPDTTRPFISLDSPCLFALDATHAEDFLAWYHRAGNECGYMAHVLAEKVVKFEVDAGVRVGFYWEAEVAGENREGRYTLDPAGVLKGSEERDLSDAESPSEA